MALKHLIWALLGGTGFAWIGACIVFDTSEISIEIDDRSGFAQLPGRVGITLETTSKNWTFIVANGAVSAAGTLPQDAPSRASEILATPPQIDRLPALDEGLDYRGPNLMSPDGRYLAVSVRRASQGMFTDVVIFDARTYTETGRVALPEDGYVRAIAWAPDSSGLAVLRNEFGSTYICPIDLMSWLVAHPISRSTYFLEIVSQHGEIVANTKLASNLYAIHYEKLVWF